MVKMEQGETAITPTKSGSKYSRITGVLLSKQIYTSQQSPIGKQGPLRQPLQARQQMNDTFSKDGWQKVMRNKRSIEKKSTDCFSTLALKEIQQQKKEEGAEEPDKFPELNYKKNNGLGGQVGKSQEQFVVFKSRVKETSACPTERREAHQGMCNAGARYMSVGYPIEATSQERPLKHLNDIGSQESQNLAGSAAHSTNGETYHSGITTTRAFKKSDASSFTQNSSESQNTKHSNETEKDAKSNMNSIVQRSNRLGEWVDKKRPHQSLKQGCKGTLKCPDEQSAQEFYNS